MATYYFQFRADLAATYYARWSSDTQKESPRLLPVQHTEGNQTCDLKKDLQKHEAGGEGDCLFYAINYSNQEGTIGVVAEEDFNEQEPESHKKKKGLDFYLRDYGRSGMMDLRQKAADAFFKDDSIEVFQDYLLDKPKWGQDEAWMQPISNKYLATYDNHEPDALKTALETALEEARKGRAKQGNAHWGDHTDIVNLMKTLETGIIVIHKENQVYCPLIKDFNFPEYILIYNQDNMHFKSVSLHKKFIFTHSQLPQALITTIKEACKQVEARVLIIEPSFESKENKLQEYVDSHRFNQVFHARTVPAAVPAEGPFDRIFITGPGPGPRLMFFIIASLLARNGHLHLQSRVEIPYTQKDIIKELEKSELDNSLLYPEGPAWHSFFKLRQ